MNQYQIKITFTVSGFKTVTATDEVTATEQAKEYINSGDFLANPLNTSEFTVNEVVKI